MSDTPRVDAVPSALHGDRGFYDELDRIYALARILEREAAALRKELAEVTAAFQAVCPHDNLERCDDSFSHEFGTEIIRYLRCEKCGKHAELDDIPHIDDDGPDPDVQRDRLIDNP